MSCKWTTRKRRPCKNKAIAGSQACHAHKDRSVCAVCMNDDDDTMTVTHCGHTYHKACLAKWSESVKSPMWYPCPVCRASLFKKEYRAMRLTITVVDKRCNLRSVSKGPAAELVSTEYVSKMTRKPRSSRATYVTNQFLKHYRAPEHERPWVTAKIRKQIVEATEDFTVTVKIDDDSTSREVESKNMPSCVLLQMIEDMTRVTWCKVARVVRITESFEIMFKNAMTK